MPSPYSSRLAFDAPIRFPDGREYHIADWTLVEPQSFDAPLRSHGGRDEKNGLFVEVEVTRVDKPHPSSRYQAWGDSFAFVLRFPELPCADEETRLQVLAFSRLWVCRHLRENAQPRSQSRHVVVIEGSFGE